MTSFGRAMWALTALTIATLSCPSVAKPVAQRLSVSDIVGTYELVDRVMANGTILKRPEIAALYTMANGRANLNLFLRKADGSIASESSIIRYTLTEKSYCEWIEHTVRNNLDAPGVTNLAPPVANHCTPIKVMRSAVLFAPPGETVTTTYTRTGFTAVIKGEFTDHWKKIG